MRHLMKTSGAFCILAAMSPHNIEDIKGFSKKTVFAFLLPLLLGVGAWGIWLYEITIVIGWKGGAWLNVNLYSIYPIIGITILSYLLPILMWSRAKFFISCICFIAMYLSALGGYFQARQAFTLLYSRDAHHHHLPQIWILFAIVLVISFVFFFLKQHFLFKSGSLHVLTIMVALILVIPASLGTIDWFPGFGTNHGFIDAVKMGYPIFWLNVMLGWTAYVMVRKII